MPTDSPPWPARSPGRAWWAIALLALSGVWILFWACLYGTGYSADATVTGGDGEGLCDVVWEDESGSGRGESDCYDEPVGSDLHVRVSGWPDPGEPATLEAYLGMALVFGLPPAVAGGAGVVLRRRRGRVTAMPQLSTPPAAEDGHDAAAVAEPTAAALSRAGRSAWALLAAGAVGLRTVVVLVAVSEAGDADLRDDGVTTIGTILGVDPGGRFDDGGASVRFTALGDTSARQVSLGSYAEDYIEGQTVVVVYDLSDPARFTIDDVPYEPAWMMWATGISLSISVLVGIMGFAQFREWHQLRRMLRTGVWAPVRARVLSEEHGLSFTTADGVPWRSVSESDWPTPNREPRELSGWGLPDEDPADVPFDQPTWWVCDGTTAVFSPDRGAPLVLARRA